MRWFWVDRYTEFIRGKSATAVKAISLAEEHLHDHFPNTPIVPASLVIEGIAQTAGLLLCEYFNFQKNVILAKITKATFHFDPLPGNILYFHVDIERLDDDGSVAKITSTCEGELHAEVKLMFAHIDEMDQGRSVFDPESYLKLMHNMQVARVGRDENGNHLVSLKMLEEQINAAKG